MDIKRFLMAMVLLIMLVNTVHAFEFDNVKTYDADSRTYTIINAFGFGDKIATVQLKSDPVVNVMRGSDRQIAEIYIESYENYTNFFQDMEFFDMKKNGQVMYKDFNLKYRIEDSYDKPIMEQVCNETVLGNGSTQYDCWLNDTGEVEEIINYDWQTFMQYDGIWEGNITLGLFIDVEPDEWGDWVGKIYGEELDIWAEWNETFTENVQAIWEFREDTTNSTNLVEVYNGTINGTLVNFGDPSIAYHNESCIVDGCLSMDRSLNEHATVGIYDSFDWGDRDLTISVWMNMNGTADGVSEAVVGNAHLSNTQGIFSYETGSHVYFYINGASSPIQTTEALEDNQWVHLVIVRNSTGANGVSLYKNGTYQQSGQWTTIATSVQAFQIGRSDGWNNPYPITANFSQVIVWNRALSQSEIIDLFNGGDGIAYLPPPAVAIDFNLSHPENYFNTTENNVTINCSGGHSEGLINLSLEFPDDTINYSVFNTTAGQNLSLEADFSGLSDGIYNWSCSGWNGIDEQSNATETYYFTLDTTAPIIDDVSNISNIITQGLPVNSTWNYSVSDLNLASCYYNTTQNTTFVTVTCNSSEILTTWNTGGTKVIEYCANDTFGFETCDTSSLTIYNYSYTQYDDKDTVGEGQTVTINLTVNLEGINSSTAVLFFNNSYYDPTTATSNSDSYFFERTFAIEDGAGNSTGILNEWYWIFNITEIVNGTQTTSDNVTVYSVEFDNCTSYTETILTLQLKDEETNTLIDLTDNTTLYSKIELDLTLRSPTTTSLIWEFNQTFHNDTNVSVCVPTGLLNDSEYIFEATAEYVTNNTVTEFFYIDCGRLTQSNVSLDSYTNKTIDLMALLLEDSTSFLFNFYDADGLERADSIVHVFRRYVGDGVYREVERGKQSDAGETNLHLVEEDVIYNYHVTECSDYTHTLLKASTDDTARCPSTTCSIILTATGDFIPFTTDYDLLPNGTYSLTKDYDNRNVTLTYNLDSSGIMNLTLYRVASSGSYVMLDSKQATGTTGSLTVNAPLTAGNYTFYAMIFKDGTFVHYEIIDFNAKGKDYIGTSLSIFLAFLIILSLVLIFVTEGALTILVVILGVLFTSLLGILELRTATGVGLLIYLITSGGIIIWKLTKR